MSPPMCVYRFGVLIVIIRYSIKVDVLVFRIYQSRTPLTVRAVPVRSNLRGVITESTLPPRALNSVDWSLCLVIVVLQFSQDHTILVIIAFLHCLPVLRVLFYRRSRLLSACFVSTLRVRSQIISLAFFSDDTQ